LVSRIAAAPDLAPARDGVSQAVPQRSQCILAISKKSLRVTSRAIKYVENFQRDTFTLPAAIFESRKTPTSYKLFWSSYFILAALSPFNSALISAI